MRKKAEVEEAKREVKDEICECGSQIPAKRVAFCKAAGKKVCCLKCQQALESQLPRRGRAWANVTAGSVVIATTISSW